VVTRQLDKAQILLEDAGLTKIVTLYRESYEDRDTVLEQRPARGQMVYEGTEVTIWVARRGYLERLREICTRHGLLLIFDEVITAFGRLGTATASEYFGVKPDLITLAKGISNGAIPLGAVAVDRVIYDTVVNSANPDSIELFHGYTYSAHPVATAAAVAALDIYQREGLFERAKSLSAPFEQAAHALRGAPHVRDVRNLGLIAGIELEPQPGKPGSRGYQVFLRCLERGVLTRYTADILAFSPPLIVEPAQIEQLFDTMAQVLRSIQ